MLTAERKHHLLTLLLAGERKPFLGEELGPFDSAERCNSNLIHGTTKPNTEKFPGENFSTDETSISCCKSVKENAYPWSIDYERFDDI